MNAGDGRHFHAFRTVRFLHVMPESLANG
ncbi:hypothetical protein AvCA_00550 [Azotobacter vinelandii CA]|uniref:Uncharacterized protein n=2 Tax=Azotobacter vinelandii TaxID=354 RepID=C1DFZ5_AZOVD|nr:hypothetical protein Avin_00550 [Azotobacter vinelandii DJ]AGK15711.1 hypothetical protein AvCA_00550 [Azotobacter vinelandii CA]AGK19036.1 hypothetical protein AvCA6_00550 [Azotobacter vinelandii CA6]